MSELISKIVPLSDLKNRGGILCHGCFDVLHIGHVRQIREARRLHEFHPLIVTITADQFIKKGAGRPIFNESIRAECLAALEDVDFVAIVHEATGVSAIQTIRPDFYVKGVEYEGQTGIAMMERIEVERCAGKMVYTARVSSSSEILERLHG